MAKRTGAETEAFVVDRVRAALDASYQTYANVHWLGRAADRGPNRDGEADLVIAHPERGILVVEIKAGEVRHEAGGAWFGGGRRLPVSPQEQARRSKHALLAKLRDLPDWERGVEPLAGHAVALPDVEVATARSLLAPDLDTAIILDGPAFDDPAATCDAVHRAFDFWARDAANRRAPGDRGLRLLDAILDPPLTLTSRLGREIAEAEPLVLQLTRMQYQVLRQHGRFRRLDVAGCAGSGKTMLAAEKARMLAREGYETLVVCFNSPLARELATDLRDTPRVAVATFHGLCERLGAEAGVLPPRPDPVPPGWFSETLPAALVGAAERLGPRYHAIVVDEGQDFEVAWLESLQFLLFDPGDDVLWVFHDAAQSLYRDDRVAALGMERIDLDVNCRNPGPIHELASRFADGQPPSFALRAEGRAPEIIAAERGRPAVDALRKVLHRLRVDEGVAPWDIAVLTGDTMDRSEAWRQRRFGNEVLWNGRVDDAGRMLGIAVEAVPDPPSDVILMDSVRRFKGLERPVIVLVELPDADVRLRQLLYVAMSRARHHLVVIATPAVVRQLHAR